MKVFFSLLFSVVSAITCFAQTPSTMNYQIMVMDPSTGKIKANKEVHIKIELRKDNANGTVAWWQEFNTTTSKSGICNLVLNFSNFHWNDGPYYLATIVDNIVCGTSMVNSIPFAMQAASLDGIITKEQLIGTWSAEDETYTFNENGTGQFILNQEGTIRRASFKYYLNKAGVLAIVYDDEFSDSINDVLMIAKDKMYMGSYGMLLYTKVSTR